jgi:hypothetical protein
MIHVEYPEPQFNFREEEDKRFIFDSIRKVWLQLTDEEWVRQNFVNYLIKVLAYPSALIALEKEISLNDLRKRFDVLVYNQAFEPWMMVECKATEVPLSPAVLEQVLRYNISIPVEYLVITNGTTTRAWQKAEGNLIELEQLPKWQGSVC